MPPPADAPDQVEPVRNPPAAGPPADGEAPGPVRAGADGFELTITPDRTFARALRRIEMRQSTRLLAATALLAVLLIATSFGSTVADAPWWTVFGFLGLAFGLVLLVIVVAWPFQQRALAQTEPIRYVFSPDAIEWSTATATMRLKWTAVQEVRALRHGYLLRRGDGGSAPLICRTTLTPEQDARLRRYFGELAGKSTTTGA